MTARTHRFVQISSTVLTLSGILVAAGPLAVTAQGTSNAASPIPADLPLDGKTRVIVDRTLQPGESHDVFLTGGANPDVILVGPKSDKAQSGNGDIAQTSPAKPVLPADTMQLAHYNLEQPHYTMQLAQYTNRLATYSNSLPGYTNTLATYSNSLATYNMVPVRYPQALTVAALPPVRFAPRLAPNQAALARNFGVAAAFAPRYAVSGQASVVRTAQIRRAGTNVHFASRLTVNNSARPTPHLRGGLPQTVARSRRARI